MPIDITGLQNGPSHSAGESTQVQSGPKQPAPAQQETGRPSTADTVSLTDTVLQLKNLEQSLSNVPVVDAQRVESLRQAVDQGRYEIDPQDVAEKLLGFDARLHGK